MVAMVSEGDAEGRSRVEVMCLLPVSFASSSLLLVKRADDGL